MKEISIKLYDYEELSPKAREKALQDWVHGGNTDDPFLQSHLINLVKEELDARGIKYDMHENTNTINCMFDLSHTQGSGLMFEGVLEWGKYTVIVKHSGHYYHDHSKTIEMYETEKDNLGHSDNDVPQKDIDAFDAIYQEVCRKVRDLGYDQIEYDESAEAFAGACEANGYAFEEDGTMRNQ